MPRNGSGTFTLVTGNPVSPGTTIESAWANTTLSDIGTEITNSLSRTGAGGMLAAFRLADGTLAAPGVAFLNETGTGLYRAGSGEMWNAVQGIQIQQYTVNGVLIPTGKTFTAQGPVSYTSTLTGGTGVVDLGSGQFYKDASGNVGLGVVPSAWGTGFTALQVNARASFFGSASTTFVGNNIFYDGTNYKYIATAAATLYDSTGGLHRWYNAPSGTAGNNITLTTAMTLDASGNLLVGTTSPSGGGERLFVSASLNGTAQRIYNYSASTPQGLYVYYPSAAPNGTASQFLTCGDSGATRAEIRSNGGLANFSANNVNLSDFRTKTDIQPATSYLDKICAIPVKTFLYKDQTDTERNLGVIAQDVDAVAPELIDHSGFGNPPEGERPYLAVYQTDLQYALMKCIQEQQALITSLTARVAALEA